MGSRRTALIGATFLKPLLKLGSIPLLPFKEDFLGSTDYIDRITQKDLTHAVMWGVDCYLRPYFTVLYLYGKNKTGTRPRLFKLVCFQRYTGSPKTWCISGSTVQPILGTGLRPTRVVLSIEAQKALTRHILLLLGGQPCPKKPFKLPENSSFVME